MKFLNQGLAAGRPPSLQPELTRGQRALFRTETAPYTKRKGGLLARLTKKSTDKPAARQTQTQAHSEIPQESAVRLEEQVSRDVGARPRKGPPTKGLPARCSAEPARSVRVTRQSKPSSTTSEGLGLRKGILTRGSSTRLGAESTQSTRAAKLTKPSTTISEDIALRRSRRIETRKK